ncbi:hypothetical protein, partial [uncultured Corynebacterium sp.]|uniref:hypothetical protein n=1 Tax=uncultured Corynebacterium sp. TaxID=159447 RepID=UPI0025DBD203
MDNAAQTADAPLADVVDDLRRRITLITGEAPAVPDAAPVSSSAPDTESGPLQEATSVDRPVTLASDALGVPSWLGRHLTRGGLPRGAVTDSVDCPAALVDVLATVTAAGGCAAVVGYPRLSLAAVEAAGGNLDRTVVIPDPAPHTGAVLGTLVEGLDLVLYHVAAPVTPTAARPVDARLRRSRCALVVVGGWPGARLHLDWRVDGVTGLGRGSGRIRGITLVGRAHGQGQPPVSFRESLGAPAAQAGHHSGPHSGPHSG